MLQTKRLPLSSILWIGVLALALLAGCGSGSGSETTHTPDSSRYFGDLPGQEATKAAISGGGCRVLRRTLEGVEHVRAQIESEPSPPSSHCQISGRGLHVSVYLDASTAARQRYYNRMTEQVQFYGTEPTKRPHAVAGVGDRGAYEHTASWIPALSTLFAVRGNRWLTISYAIAGGSNAARKAQAAALARRAFRLTAN